MSIMRDVAGNYFIQAGGRVLSVILGFVSIAILTRTLGQTGFGEWTTAITFLTLFGVLVDFGLTLTLIQMIAPKGADEENIVGNFFGLRLVSGFMFFGLAPIAVLALPYPTPVKLAVALGAFGFLFMSASGMLGGIFQKHLIMWRFAVAELINRAVLLILIAVFAFLGFGLQAMVIALVLANFVWLIATIILAKPYVTIRPKFDLSVWKNALSQSWPIALSVMFNLMYLKGDIIILAFFREQAEVGLYGVAYKVVEVLTALPVMFMGLMLPTLTRFWTSGEKGEFRNHVQKTFDFFAITVIPIVIGAQVVADAITIFIGGAEYEASGPVLRILAFAMIGVFFGALYGHTIVAINKQKIMALGYAITAAITVVGYFIFVPEYGMYGAAYMTLISEVLITLMTFFVVFKHAKTKPNLLITSKAVASSAIMYAVLVVLPETHVLIDVTIGAVVYITTLVGFGGVKLSTIKSYLPRQNAR